MLNNIDNSIEGWDKFYQESGGTAFRKLLNGTLIEICVEEQNAKLALNAKARFSDGRYVNRWLQYLNENEVESELINECEYWEKRLTN